MGLHFPPNKAKSEDGAKARVWPLGDSVLVMGVAFCCIWLRLSRKSFCGPTGPFFGFLLHFVAIRSGDGFVAPSLPPRTSFDITVAWPLPPDWVLGSLGY